MCKVYLISEKTGGRSKKLSDELKVENLPHYAGPGWAIPRPGGCYNVRVELSRRKQKSNTGTFLLRRKDKTKTVLFCELL